jgi:hypothetical protein
MENDDIRKEIENSGIKYWQIAQLICVNDGNLSRKLRRKLTPDETQRIREAIEKIKKEKK